MEILDIAYVHGWATVAKYLERTSTSGNKELRLAIEDVKREEALGLKRSSRRSRSTSCPCESGPLRAQRPSGLQRVIRKRLTRCIRPFKTRGCRLQGRLKGTTPTRLHNLTPDTGLTGPKHHERGWLEIVSGAGNRAISSKPALVNWLPCKALL